MCLLLRLRCTGAAVTVLHPGAGFPSDATQEGRDTSLLFRELLFLGQSPGCALSTHCRMAGVGRTGTRKWRLCQNCLGPVVRRMIRPQEGTTVHSQIVILSEMAFLVLSKSP